MISAILASVLYIFPFAQRESHVYSVENLMLEIRIEGIREARGQIMIAVHSRAETFPSGPDPFASQIIPVITTDGMSTTFDSIPAGQYAVSIFHDVNENQVLDTNFFGIPSEPYGFSNNAKGTFGPPKFEDARFLLGEEREVQVIRLR